MASLSRAPAHCCCLQNDDGHLCSRPSWRLGSCSHHFRRAGASRRVYRPTAVHQETYVASPSEAPHFFSQAGQCQGRRLRRAHVLPRVTYRCVFVHSASGASFLHLACILPWMYGPASVSSVDHKDVWLLNRIMVLADRVLQHRLKDDQTCTCSVAVQTLTKWS